MKVVILTASTMKKELDGKAFSGKCVTALDLDNNKIMRFVQNRHGAPVENPYCDVFEPLDCFDITVTERCPLLCQTENVLVNYQFAHENYLGKYEGSIQDLYERFKKIHYGDSSFMLDGSYKLMDITPFKHSLELIRVSELIIEGKKCSFRHKNKHFRFVSITDPQYVMPDKAEKKIGDAILAVSIPTDNYKEMGYYKFVASIFPIEKPWTKEEDEELLYEYRKGWQLQLMCAAHKRSEAEIKKRLSMLL